MNSLTKEVPKALVNIAGKTLLEWAVERYNQSGIKDIVVAVGWKGSMIEEFASQNNLGVRIIHVPDYEIGPLRTFLTAIDSFDGDFLLSPVDALIEPATMVDILSKQSGLNKTGNICLSFGRSTTTGTPVETDDADRIIAIGATVPDGTDIARSAMLLLANTSIREVCESVLKKGKTRVLHVLEQKITESGFIQGFQVFQPWFDIDTFSDILSANEHILQRGGIQNPDSVFIPKGDTIEIGDTLSLKSIRMGKGTSLQGPVLITSNCKIGEHCRVGPNVTVNSNCTISNDCEVANTVIFGEAQIPASSRVYNCIIHSSNQYKAEI
jgi:NDP-sugar pyrophosphorylase family protein